MSLIAYSRARRWSWLALASTGLSLWLAVCSRAQQAPPEEKPAQPSAASQAGPKPSDSSAQKPEEKKPAEKKPEEKKPEEKPSSPPQEKIQLETPQEPPTEQPAPLAPGALQVPQPRPTVEQPKEAVIEDIIFRGNRRIPAATLRARIFSHRGDVYDENSLERDFMALWNTGFLDDIRLEVTDGEKGKIVTFYVREKKLVRSIDYKGLSTVATSDVLDRYKEKKVGLTIQSQYDPVLIKRAQVVLQQLLAEHGRQFATVRARTRNIPPNSVALTFIVVEGPKVKVGKVRFQGNTVFSSQRLERSMKYTRSVGAPPWFYWFHKTYDKEKLQADLELSIRSLYQDHGYFYAVLKEPQTKMLDTKRRWPFFFFSWGRGKRIDITLPIEEGAQYRLGRFVIRGNKLFKQEQLAREPFFALKTGDIFNLSKVRKSIENYRKLYGEFGYINFTADPDIEPDNKKHVINLALDFQEEKQFLVHRIEFSGNTKTRDKVLRRELLLDEGNVFNSALWDYSVLRTNQLGFFDSVKKEDYEIKQNPKEGNVDILLKVKEKGRNSIGFQGGVSGLSGNFVGVNYATNNFLGLGETLSLQAQFGTYQKLYSFSFTEPYLFDRPITTGFTIFKSDYRYDQLRQVAYYSRISPEFLASNPFAASSFQNFQQNSAGFTMFASYPLRRIAFARVGLTYSYSVSSLQAFSPASQNFFQALMFRGLAGPNALSGIISSSVMPTFVYNTVNDAWNPTSGKYIYAALSFSGSVLGGNVNTLRPVLELKYFHPINKRRNTLGFRFLASMVTGYGGRVAPPFSRFYVGGEEDIRGFDIRTLSPIAFYPTVGTVCNRDNAGNPIWAVDQTGKTQVGTCGSSTKFPFNTFIFPGGDTTAVANFEYRIPIAGPVTAAYFVDIGSAFVWRESQLKVQPSALKGITDEFSFFVPPKNLRAIAVTNFRPRSTTGIEFQVILPIVNAPFRVFWGYNWLRLDNRIVPPQTLPPEAIFPNQFTYDAVQFAFRPLHLRERSTKLGFTVARTF